VYAEPGKIMHELRLGELAHFKLVPHTPYYAPRTRHRFTSSCFM
jgi:glycogen debranching enzyme